MPIEIREIVTEVVIRGPDEPSPVSAAAPGREPMTSADAEALVRQAVERVLDVLRREWER